MAKEVLNCTYYGHSIHLLLQKIVPRFLNFLIMAEPTKEQAAQERIVRHMNAEHRGTAPSILPNRGTD